MDAGAPISDAGADSDRGVWIDDLGVSSAPDGGDAAIVDGGEATDAGIDGGVIIAMRTVYVSGQSGSIQKFDFDNSTGILTGAGMINGGQNPSFLAFHPSLPVLYAADESGRRMRAFAIDASGDLSALGDAQMPEGRPAHVSTDRAGAFLLAANYGEGTVRVFPLDANGAIGAPSGSYSPGTNPHLILTDPTDSFAFVPCKGSDKVEQYSYAAGVLTPNGQLDTAEGTGPRHLAFHPLEPYVYLINELDSTMSALRLEFGRLDVIAEPVSLLPEGFGGDNTGADVHVSPNGRFVYGSNRGHNSIVIYAVEEGRGRLTLIGHEDVRGEVPRNFTLDETGTWLLVANQLTDNVVVFAVDPVTGLLTYTSEVATENEPQFVGFRPL